MFDAEKYFYGILPENEREKIAYMPTLCDLIRQGEREYADLPAMSDYEHDITYKQLAKEVGELRGFLKEQGVKKGDKVGILFRNDLNFIRLYFAVTTSGAVAVLLPVQLGAQALFGCSKKFELSLLLLSDEFAEAAEGLPVRSIKASEIKPGEYADYADVKKEDDCVICFTGGTTGKPKGALLTHGAMMRGAFNGCFVNVSTMHQRYYALIPFTHVFGLVRNLMTCIYTGSVIYTPRGMGKQIFADMAVAQPTLLVLVPAMADMFLGAVSMMGEKALGGRLKLIIAGAAPVPPATIKRYADMGISMLPGYGLTESANLVSGNCDIADYPDSVGYPYSAQELKIVDGELWLRGENMFKCYYNDPEETANAMEDGWFKTGDLARIENDRLFIVGRTKNVIILPNGENVSPEEIELHLYRIPIVKDALVKAMKNENGFEIIAAEIFPNMPAAKSMGIEDVKAALEEAVDKVNAELPSFMHIARVIVREQDFERNAAMKIVRKK